MEEDQQASLHSRLESQVRARSQEEQEEVEGKWQSGVGRIKAGGELVPHLPGYTGTNQSWGYEVTSGYRVALEPSRWIEMEA